MKPSTKSWLIRGSIGAVILAAAVVAFYGIPSRPTYIRSAARLQRMVPRLELGSVVPDPTSDGKAADAYHRALQALEIPTVAAILMRLDRNDEPGSVDSFPTEWIDHLLEAAERKDMDYAARFVAPDEAVIEEPSYASPFMRLAEITHWRAGTMTAETDEGYAQAERLHQAVVVMGHHLLADRLRYEGLLTALGVQQIGLQGLYQLYSHRDDTERARAVQAYSDALLDLERRFDRKARRTLYRLPMPTGDLMAMARDDQDRSFRIEAIRRLGYVRWTRYSTRGDRRTIESLLKTLAADPDPFVQAAARWAAERTALDVRQLY